MFRVDDPLYNFHIWFQEQKVSQSADWELVFKEFQKAIWDFYSTHKRTFAWRQTVDPYAIVVSEIMLQQTQTQRVAQKFPEFISKFPTFDSLAQASTQELLTVWVGLGYNRRAFALQSIAQAVVAEYKGVLPDDPAVLQTFKGIGPATAASITAFTYNKPTVFIETNIRAVYLHIFFHNHAEIADKLLLPFIERTVDQNNTREWYYALMDYGVVIKKLYPNPSRKSKHHVQQSAFEGSDRQVRGAVIKLLSKQNELKASVLHEMFPEKSASIDAILAQMCKEGIIKNNNSTYFL